MTEMVYFDNAATTRISRKALDTYNMASDAYWANPSSLHHEGLKAKSKLDECRKKLSLLLAVPEDTLTFTSCATEADSIIMESFLWAPQCGEVLMPNIEHGALTGFTRLFRQKGWTVTALDAPQGFLDPEDVRRHLSEKTRLVLCMLVNNVMGTIEPVAEIVKVVRKFEQETGRKIHVHTDATQALGKIPFSLVSLDVDSAAFSAHKLHGPKGVGLLYNRNKAITALSRGGEQEAGLRPGTENLPGIMAMTAAVEDALDNEETNLEKVRHLNALLRERLSPLQGVTILTPAERSSPYILNISTEKYPSEVLTRMLYDKDFCVSSGSACSNNAKQHQGTILSSMQVSPKQSRGSIRISLGNDNTEEEVMALADALSGLLGGD